MYVYELVLVQNAVDDKVQQRDGNYQRLDEAEDQAEQQGDAGVRDLPPVVHILSLPQPGFCTLCACQKSLDAQQNEACGGKLC